MNNSINNNKALIVISGSIFVRNYLTTNALNGLRQEFDCKFLISSTISERDFNISDDYIYRYRTSPNQNLHYKILDLLMWKYQGKSKSFSYRIKRQFIIRNLIFNNPRQFIINIYKRLFYKIVIINRVFEKYYDFLKSGLEISKDINFAIERFNPSIVIFPSSAYDPDGFDLLSICKKKKIKTFFLVDNWDNLSSKSLLWEKPDFIGVWGEQSMIHASKIQNFEINKIFKIGTPRFDNYFLLRNENLQSMFEYKYILFVGTSLAFDEASVLKHLDEIITTNKKLFPNTKIIYRPHPWRAGNDSIIDLNLHNVIIDPQLKNKYLSKENSSQYQPSLDYYPSLIKNAEFVIGGLTSMLIESLIFYKKFLALIYEDKNYITSPRQVYLNYTHFENINDISTVTFCDNLNNLEKLVIKTWETRLNVDKNQTDLQREYFYHYDGKSYSQKLIDYTKLILENKSN